MPADTSDAESEADSEVFQQQLEELGGRLNVESDRTGFLAMINRTHTFNSSAVSLGSILSLTSSTGGPTPQRTTSFKVCTDPCGALERLIMRVCVLISYLPFRLRTTSFKVLAAPWSFVMERIGVS